MKFIVAEEIFQKLPNACFGVVMARGLKNDRPQPAVAQAFEAALAAAQARFQNAKIKELPEIAPYRDAFRTLGINPNKYPCSIEALFSRIAKGKGLPAINPIVDLGNAVSLAHVVPIGAHDLAGADADIMVRPAEAGDIFTPFGAAESEAPEIGEAVYAVGNVVRTRRWTWRQSEIGKITPATTDVFFPIDGFAGFNEVSVLAARDAIAQSLKAIFGVVPVVGFVDAAHPEMALNG